MLYWNIRALVGMMMYNPETSEIAKPSELLNSVKAIMSVLQSIENYGKVVMQIVNVDNALTLERCSIVFIFHCLRFQCPHLFLCGFNQGSLNDNNRLISGISLTF